MPTHFPRPRIRQRGTLIRLLVFVMAGSSGGALAMGTMNDQARAPLIDEFRKLDRNGDGKLSGKEANRDSDIARRFGQADGNHDGALSPEEYGNFKSAAQRARLETYLDDSGVTARIKTELAKDSGVNSLSINVQTYQGRVILSGFVDNARQARRAMEIASGVRGVQHVSNSLLLKNAARPQAMAPRPATGIVNAKYPPTRPSTPYFTTT